MTFLKAILRVLDFRISLLFFIILCRLLLSRHRTTVVYCEKSLMAKWPCHLGNLQPHVEIQLYLYLYLYLKIFPGYWFTGSVWLYPGDRWQEGNWALSVLYSLLHKPNKSLNEFIFFLTFILCDSSVLNNLYTVCFWDMETKIFIIFTTTHF